MKSCRVHDLGVPKKKCNDLELLLLLRILLFLFCSSEIRICMIIFWKLESFINLIECTYDRNWIIAYHIWLSFISLKKYENFISEVNHLETLNNMQIAFIFNVFQHSVDRNCLLLSNDLIMEDLKNKIKNPEIAFYNIWLLNINRY